MEGADAPREKRRLVRPARTPKRGCMIQTRAPVAESVRGCRTMRPITLTMARERALRTEIPDPRRLYLLLEALNPG
jgi:hypothetical protein